MPENRHANAAAGNTPTSRDAKCVPGFSKDVSVSLAVLTTIAVTLISQSAPYLARRRWFCPLRRRLWALTSSPDLPLGSGRCKTAPSQTPTRRSTCRSTRSSKGPGSARCPLRPRNSVSIRPGHRARDTSRSGSQTGSGRRDSSQQALPARAVPVPIRASGSGAHDRASLPARRMRCLKGCAPPVWPPCPGPSQDTRHRDKTCHPSSRSGLRICTSLTMCSHFNIPLRSLARLGLLRGPH
ncbi:hypothetical protein J3F83DRAFT_469329 [Trichoderma novae-zelandiae]